MPRKRADTDELRRKDRVVAVAPIKDIPEGTLGTVKMVVGQAWTRYLVSWDTGEWVSTIDGSKIVREDRLGLYHERMAAEKERANRPVVAVGATAPEGDQGGGGGRVPEHLLERSRAARERAAAKAPA
jgi:hypothetical protein